MEELRTKRKSLWDRFESNPNEIQLASELKIIDDLIADCNAKRNCRSDEMAECGHASDPGLVDRSVLGPRRSFFRRKGTGSLGRTFAQSSQGHSPKNKTSEQTE
jgi:hypothetical protein